MPNIESLYQKLKKVTSRTTVCNGRTDTMIVIGRPPHKNNDNHRTTGSCLGTGTCGGGIKHVCERSTLPLFWDSGGKNTT